MLAGLFAGALEDAELRAESVSAKQLEATIAKAAPSIDAIAALAKSPQVKVLAEIKRASPSKGKLNAITDVVTLAMTYQTGGASAISVLTESRGFLGSLDDLRAVRAATNIPLLRKDFISTEYQILEARAAGADIILLIVAGLPSGRLIELKQFAEQLGLAVLVETHNEGEVRFAVDIDTKLLGINARDLSTFETDRDLFSKLSHLIPSETIKIAESAVRDADDVRHYRAAGADVVLIGEALVTGDAELLLRQFTSV